MGFALPAAIGAKFARPDAEVWVVVGDGGFQMTMAELATIVQEKIDIKIAIINNGYPGDGPPVAGIFLRWPLRFHADLEPGFRKARRRVRNFRRLGAHARRNRSRPATAARKNPGPALIDFQVEQEDSVYPMVPAGADLHAMIRRPSPLVEKASDA